MAWKRISADLEEQTGRTVAAVRELESVASSVYDVTFADSDRVVVKVPRIEQGYLAEPRLLELIATGSDIPVPAVLLLREETDPSYFVTEYRHGVGIGSFEELTWRERRWFAAEMGRLLGTIHGVDSPVTTFGRIRCDADGSLHTIEDFRTWRPRFEDLVGVNLDALAELGLADLVPRLRGQFDAASESVPDVTTPTLNYFDCKVENFVLTRDESGLVVDSVVDWEGLSTAHWAFNLAFPERYLRRRSATPAERTRLVEDLYAGYAEGRGWEDLPLDDWYTTHLLAAFVLLAASPYWLADRDDWSGEAAESLRSHVRALLDE